MFSLHKKTDHALVALACLAELMADDVEQTMSAREIAERYELPVSQMMQIMKILQNHDLVNSHRGAHGGYQLRREPSNISLLEIIESVEGPIRISCCCDASEEKSIKTDESCEECKTLEECPVSPRLRDLNDLLSQWLSQFSLNDLISEQPLKPRHLSLPITNSNYYD